MKEVIPFNFKLLSLVTAKNFLYENIDGVFKAL